ncbi:MAG: TlpA family protein disulfide reductase [Flavobacteriales bacterium]|nr:TlpA family protein disulfide reductase [Flavobacteriales bacterium]
MRRYFQTLLTSVFLVITVGCTEQQPTTADSEVSKDEIWRFTLQLNSDVLPFTALVENGFEEGSRLRIHNADETISVSLDRISGDTLYYRMPVFNSELALRRESPELVTGTWTDFDRKNYSIPVIAESGMNFRFTPTKSTTELAPRYKVRFGGPDGYDALLLLDNDRGHLTGTFLTETGDYRYLEGNIMNGKVNLSTFDGSHAFVFDALISGDSLKSGRFISGTHYSEQWIGVADEDFELSHPTELVSANSTIEPFTFSLPDLNGDTVTHLDFIDGKTIHIYDITGSWCPNCKDAALTLEQIASTYDSNAIRVIPIAFERSNDLNTAKQAISRMQNDLELQEYFLFGGKVSRENTTRAFPALEKIMAYPTIVITDKHGHPVKVFTGFYGPGTGFYHDRFKADITTVIDSLISQ